MRELSSIPSNRQKGAQRAVQNERLFLGRRAQEKEGSSEGWIVSGKVIYLWETEGFCQGDYLTGIDQVTAD